ncbi:hypothetical protein R1flu_001112 [Riccia fluitans]|uniref:Uncharacterized protein n=1 Tax=Riccia fluitans TaxID=41844 RepID=A0ABD1Y2E2_9MARC
MSIQPDRSTWHRQLQYSLRCVSASRDCICVGRDGLQLTLIYAGMSCRSVPIESRREEKLALKQIRGENHENVLIRMIKTRINKHTERVPVKRVWVLLHSFRHKEKNLQLSYYPWRRRRRLWIEPEGGGFYRTFAAKKLNVAWGADKRYWLWLPAADVPGARFEEVANLMTASWLHLTGDFKVRLPPGTYSLRWVLKFPSSRDDISDNIRIIFPPVQEGGRHGRNEEYQSRVRWKEDGWIEYVAGVFTVEEGVDDPVRETNREVHLKFEMKETACLWWKSNMLVDGVIIRQHFDSADNMLNHGVGTEARRPDGC